MKHSDNKNEFDDLMKNAFDGFEIEPTDRVWRNIESELDKKKKSVLVLWSTRISIAASLIILLGVGLYQMSYNNDATNTSDLASTNMKAVEKKDSNTTLNKVEKKSELMQPISKENRLADVVEIKSKTNRSSKINKKSLSSEPKLKRDVISNSEKEAVELLKKFEEKAQSNNNQPVLEPEQKRPVIVKPVPSPAIANAGSKKEIGVIDMINMVASKVSGNEEAKLVAINETNNKNGDTRKRVQVDLGIIKFKRIKNTQ